ncbi:MAG: peptidylprolyl isomerase [Gammaproteobacteria bacterium]
MARSINNPLIITTALALFAPAALAAEPLDGSGQLLDRIVAVVNDGVVLQSEVATRGSAIVARLRADGVQLPPADVLEKQIVEKLVVDTIQLQRAERLGVSITDDQLNSALGSVAERNGISLTQLPDALAQQGVDYAAYRDDIRREMMIEQLRNRDLVPRVTITRKEVEDYVKRRDAGGNTDYEISHILISVPPGASPEDREQAEALANELYERANSGEDFAQLAVAHSKGQQALEGGKIGWRKAEQLPTLFADTVLEMEAGQVAEPIASGSGFHLVKLDQTRGAAPVMVTQRLARHILISPNELLTDTGARDKLITIAQDIKDGEDFAALAKEHSDDKGTGSKGGDLGWANSGTYVPEFEAALDAMQPGDMSDPVRSPFGWHLIELMDTREKDNSEEASLNEAYGQVRARKLQQETERWLLQLRDEAFVDYRT